MKFLENDRLAQLTAQLTEAKICERVINGRIEAFTTKRAGTDKKFAHALGEKYQHEIEVEETEFSNLQRRSMQSQSQLHKTETNQSTTVKQTNTNANTNTQTKTIRPQGLLPPKILKKNMNSNIRKLTSPPSPKSKRVKIDLTKTTTSSSSGRRRSNSTSSIPNFNSNPSPIVSALRSRSDSFDRRSNNNIVTNFPYSNSPLGDFHDTSTQRLMTDLILTLNASFPDYEFSNIRPSHFSRSPSSSVAINRTNERLSELAACTPQGANFLSQLWNSIDDVIDLNESEVFSYVPPSRDDDDDPLSFLVDSLDGTDSAMPLWTFNFFFVNKSLKRILLFTCAQTMRTEVEGMDELNAYDNDNEIEYENESFVTGMGMGISASDDVKDTEAPDFGSPQRGVQRGDSALSRTEVATSMEEEDEGGVDFDMDADCMNQAITPPTTVH